MRGLHTLGGNEDQIKQVRDTGEDNLKGTVGWSADGSDMYNLDSWLVYYSTFLFFFSKIMSLGIQILTE